MDTAEMFARITGLSAAYAWHVDSRDWVHVEQCFDSAARLDLPDRIVTGARDIAAAIRHETAKFERMRHLVYPPHILGVENGRVEAVSHYDLRWRLRRGLDFHAVGTYRDLVDVNGTAPRYKRRAIGVDFYGPGERWSWSDPAMERRSGADRDLG